MAKIIEIPYRPREYFKPFHDRSQRWACLVAHRRSGKTVAAVNDLVRGAATCKLPRPFFRYISPFYTQAKAVAWEYLKFYAQPITVQKNESELWVEVLGGGRIRLFGADNADAMRGQYSDGDFLDEYGDFKPSVWGNVIRPTLSDRQGWAVFGGTPKGKNQFWDIRELARKSPDEWFLLTLPASVSKLLPDSELRDAAKQLTIDQYEQEYECSFEAAILGSFYGREMSLADREGRICEVGHDTAAPVFTAWDLGYSDDTAIWWFQVIGGEIHVIDFYSSSGMNIEHYAQKIEEKGHYNYKMHYLPHDAKAKTLASGGKSIIEQLASFLPLAKLSIVPNLSVQDGIQAVRMAMRRCWFHIGIEEGLEALRQYQREYDEDKKAFRDKPRHDWTSHPADAFRMLAIAWKEEYKEALKDLPIRGIAVGNPHNVTLEELYATAEPRGSARI